MTGHDYLDPATLWDVACGDAATFRHLTAIFCDTAPGYMAQLHSACAQGDLGAAARACHALLGMSMLLGAEALSDLLGALERQARVGEPLTELAELEVLLTAVSDEARRNALQYRARDPA